MREITWFLWMLLLLILLVAFVGRLEYKDGYEAGIAAKETKPNIDQQCVAWLFDNNLKEARQRMCGRKM